MSGFFWLAYLGHPSYVRSARLNGRSHLLVQLSGISYYISIYINVTMFHLRYFLCSVFLFPHYLVKEIDFYHRKVIIKIEIDKTNI